VISNIDLLSAFKVSTQDSNSKAVSSISSAADKPNSFKYTLKAAVGSRNQNGTKRDEKISIGTEDSIALRKTLAAKSEAKLRNARKTDTKNNKNVNQAEESIEKQKDVTIEEILLQLEELGKMQQAGDNALDKQAALLENIQKAINGLASVQTDSVEGSGAEILQTKLAELSAVLEGMQEELKTNGSLTGKEAYENFAEELSKIVEEISEEAETASNKPAEHSDIEQLKGQANKTSDELAMSDKKAGDKSYEEPTMQNINEDDNMTAEALEKQKQDRKTEALMTDTKSAYKEALNKPEESTDGVKTALDSKLEKADISDKNKKQDSEAGTDNEASKEVYKAADAIKNKPVNEEMTAVKLEQAAVDNTLEAVKNQAAAPKAQTANKAEIINQIVKKAEVIINDEQPEMRMQLEPENLGKLTLKIAVEKGLITAKFVAESQEVKKIIESNFNELKDMLQEKGLEVQNFSVSVGHDDREYNNSNAFQQWKETVKQNGRGTMRSSYGGYMTDDGTARPVNPYSIHNGEFDHRA